MVDDDRVVHKLCDCRDRAAHAACLERWVETSRSSECPVCRTTYTGEIGAALRHLAFRARHVRALARVTLLVGSAGTLTLLAVLVARTHDGGRKAVTEGVTIGAMLAAMYVCALTVSCYAALSGAGDPVLV